MAGEPVTKLDAARRQLETAITLWFADGDFVSIHTLAAAAHAIVHDVALKKGIRGTPLFDEIMLPQLGYDTTSYKRAIRKAENFFKHAKDDPHGIFDCSQAITECIMFSTIECYLRLVSEKSLPISMFRARYMFQFPQLLNENLAKQYANLLPALANVSRKSFSDNFLVAGFDKIF